jgi:hypothetical protein
MNEHIKRLARQAGFDVELMERNHANGNPSMAHQFAELIVRECLEACSRANEIRHFVPPTQQQVVLSCIDEIERTFRS